MTDPQISALLHEIEWFNMVQGRVQPLAYFWDRGVLYFRAGGSLCR